jgi:hypothetical protein
MIIWQLKNNQSNNYGMKSIHKNKWVKIQLLIITLVCFQWQLAAQNVGIGTTNPTGRLHIDLNGTANTFAIIIDDDDDPVIRIRKAGVSKSFLEQFGDDFRIGTYATNPLGKLVFRTNSTTRMSFTPAGNIGVGISDPVGQFQIATGTDASATQHGYLMLGTENSDNIVFDNNEILARNNGVVSTLFLARDGSKVQMGNGSEATGTKLHISTGNDVGLPDNLSGFLMMGSQTGLNVVADNNEIQARNNGLAANLTLQNGGGNVYIGDLANFTNSHRLGVDGNAVITGAVRIGTTVTPSGYKLAVDGKMICTEVLVRLVANWPDYVFNKNYRLPGLDEVESFIQKNKHLPGIPSAAAIEKGGVSLGEMQKLQMEKIEQLTLYIIELKKEIEKLKAQQ